MKDLIIARVDKARMLLAEAKNAVQAKKVSDMAHAAEIYAKRQQLSDESIRYAHSVKIDAMTLLGAFLSMQPKNKGAKGNPGGRGNKNVRCQNGSTQPAKLSDNGITHKESSISQKLYKLSVEQPEKHSLIREADTPITSVFSSAHVSNNSGNNEWYTPEDYIKAAKSVLGSIDLDPASAEKANEVVEAKRFFSKEDDGLKQDWEGSVWMNPPYESGLIDKFAQKLTASVAAGAVKEAIALVNNATETKWFQLLAESSSALCFPRSRIKFWHPSKFVAAPLQGQAILYFGKAVKTFCDSFSKFGFCCQTF